MPIGVEKPIFYRDVVISFMPNLCLMSLFALQLFTVLSELKAISSFLL
jgi:hypothetical protein